MLEVGFEGVALAGKVFQEAGLVDVFGDVVLAAGEEGGVVAALGGEDEDAAIAGPAEERGEGVEPGGGREVREERAAPDEIELFAEREGAEVGLRVDAVDAEPGAAEVDGVAVEVAGGEFGVWIRGAQPAEDAAVAAGQIEDAGERGVFAEVSGELDELESAAAEGEVFVFHAGPEHRVARGDGAVDGEGCGVGERHGTVLVGRGGVCRQVANRGDGACS